MDQQGQVSQHPVVGWQMIVICQKWVMDIYVSNFVAINIRNEPTSNHCSLHCGQCGELKNNPTM